MIEIKDLSYSIPEKDLYKKINMTIEDNAHYALIGTNGTGKSTLVDMILDSEEYLYKGKIIYSDDFKNSRVGYVSQFADVDMNTDMTVFDYISQEFIELDKKIEVLCDRMATEEDLDAVFAEYQVALDEKEAIDGDNYDVNIRKQLKIAGIEKLENQKLSALSGGEFKLIQVIKEMLLSPKIMFMDEPDVFLDFDHVNALVKLINAHKGTLVVITHSRYLLNHCFDHIIHLEGCDIQQFEGSYNEYNLELLATKIDIQEVVAKEEEEIARHQAIVNKVRGMATAMDNASLGRTVHARQTLLDRLQARKTKLPFVEIKQPEITFHVDHMVGEGGKVDAETAEAVDNAELETAADNAEAQAAVVETDNTTAENAKDSINVLELRHYEVAFDEQLLKDINFEMKPTDKVAIIGKNGTGKTTLLKEIWEHQKDSIIIHPEAEMAMFSQVIGDVMDADKTMEEIMWEFDFETNAEVREYLGRFGFTEEEMQKQAGQLSGGERDLFQLAVLQKENANLLLLDEPTGHLDTYAQVALEEAIRKYKGGVLMVSHDFYIVANCMDYVLLVEDNQIRRMSIRKFRQMIYQNYFDKDYLLLEDKKKDLELRIAQLLQKRDFEKAKLLLEQLEAVIKKMK